MNLGATKNVMQSVGFTDAMNKVKPAEKSPKVAPLSPNTPNISDLQIGEPKIWHFDTSLLNSNWKHETTFSVISLDPQMHQKEFQKIQKWIQSSGNK